MCHETRIGVVNLSGGVVVADDKQPGREQSKKIGAFLVVVCGWCADGAPCPPIQAIYVLIFRGNVINKLSI